MSKEERREAIIQDIANHLRTIPFTVEFKVKKNQPGKRVIRMNVIYEVTQKWMDDAMERSGKMED